MPESTQLACPDCRGVSFTWLTEQVELGTIHELSNGRRDAETVDMGPVTDCDLDTKGAFCTNCDEHKSLEELVRNQ